MNRNLDQARIVLAREPAVDGKDPVIRVLHADYDAVQALKVYRESEDKFPEVIMVEHPQATRRRANAVSAPVEAPAKTRKTNLQKA